MRRSTFNVLFYVKKSQPRKNGQCPVMGRITIDGVAVQFSCKFEVDPKIWDADAGRATGRSEQARDANRLLDRIGASLTEHYREIVNRDGFVTAGKVKNAYLGMDMRCETLLKIFERHNVDFEKMVQSGSRSPRTLYKYQNVCNLPGELNLVRQQPGGWSSTGTRPVSNRSCLCLIFRLKFSKSIGG